jgi:hypothetical protein
MGGYRLTSALGGRTKGLPAGRYEGLLEQELGGPMSVDDRDAEFFDLVDHFINLANELVHEHETPRVSSALLFAASRFNAHNYYATDGDPSGKEPMIEYYRDQYHKMLLDNLDWLAESE